LGVGIDEVGAQLQEIISGSALDITPEPFKDQRRGGVGTSGIVV
jgi:hypothetical protein